MHQHPGPAAILVGLLVGLPLLGAMFTTVGLLLDALFALLLPVFVYSLIIGPVSPERGPLAKDYLEEDLNLAYYAEKYFDLALTAESRGVAQLRPPM